MRNYIYLVLLLLVLLPLTSAILFDNPNLPIIPKPEAGTGGDITNYYNNTYINQSGGSNDGNNYTTGIFISGGSTKNITLSRSGMGNISAIFTDNEGTDTDTYLTSVTATNGSQHLFNFSVPGQTPIYVSIDDLDSWAGNISFYYTKTESDNKYLLISNWNATNTSYYLASNPSGYITSSALSPYLLISNWNATNTSYYLASNPNGYISSYTETDPYWTGNKSTYDDNNISMGNYVRYVNGTCSAYTDAKLNLYYLASNPSGYITDGNTNWDNSYNFITNSTMNKSVWCGSIIGGTDPDFCTDSTGTGGGVTWAEVMNGTVLLDLNLSTNRSINNASLFVDATNNKVGINTYTPTERLEISNGAIKVGYITDTFDQLVMFMRNNVLIGAIDNNAGDVRLKALNNNKVQIIDDANNGITVNDGGEVQISNLTSANCDVKSWTNGSIYCGTDATGSGSGGLNAWVNSTNTTTYNRTGSATDLIISELNATLKAGSYYVVNCMVGYKTAIATTGITWNMSFSTGVLSQTLVAEFPASATTISTVTSTTTGYAGFNATGSGGVNNLGFLKISGGIRTAGTDVSVIHKFKSELASPQWTWVNGDSWCQYTKMY